MKQNDDYVFFSEVSETGACSQFWDKGVIKINAANEKSIWLQYLKT